MRTRPVRYRFALSGAAAEVDVVLSPDGAAFRLNAASESDGPADVIFRCAADTYAMIIFGRLKLAAALSGGARHRISVGAEGDAGLVDDFIAAFVGG